MLLLKHEENINWGIQDLNGSFKLKRICYNESGVWSKVTVHSPVKDPWGQHETPLSRSGSLVFISCTSECYPDSLWFPPFLDTTWNWTAPASLRVLPINCSLIMQTANDTWLDVIKTHRHKCSASALNFIKTHRHKCNASALNFIVYQKALNVKVTWFMMCVRACFYVCARTQR